MEWKQDKDGDFVSVDPEGYWITKAWDNEKRCEVWDGYWDNPEDPDDSEWLGGSLDIGEIKRNARLHLEGKFEGAE